ncbi:lysylphosphatidylglycerol synthase domain-containing protein [Carbonactinospora thermoautotrophica]|uniref:lysylphosphatidylglycerol synthase domain-containing protein n=1 Tax=Carbonactinospora thermoautotrophica TaxID=1469144 RepID=UPI002270AC24|nr:lysylphosphatidylglycerol synthase domain-containing protein [Carbonactinospora thermoautotrophica]
MPTIARLTPRRALGWLFVAAAVALGGYALAAEWQAVRADLGRLHPLAYLASLAAVVVALAASMLVWRSLLAALGSPLPVGPAARIVFLANLGKYLPGSVWPVIAQMELGHTYQVPRRRSAAAFVLYSLLTLGSGAFAALVTLPWVAAGASYEYRWVFLLGLLLLAGLHPRVLNPALGLLFRFTRRPAPECPLTLRGVGAAFGWALLTWLAYGVHAWVLAAGLGAPYGQAFLLCVGGFALAWCAGFLAVVAPAGAGVRDWALVALLLPVLDHPAALVVALLSRLLMSVGDLVVAGLALWAGARRRRPTPVRAG